LKLRVCSNGWWNKHFIAAAVKVGLVEFPGPVSTLFLEKKKKKPKNNTAALIRQPSEAYSQKGVKFQDSSAVRKINSHLEYILL
jgi:hypothetical protein